MKRKAEELNLDSLIEGIELMNCLNGYDEYKILKESCQLKNNIQNLQIKQIYEILNNSYKRYKRYLASINMDNNKDIREEIYKYIRTFKKEVTISHFFIKIKKLIDTMLKIDTLIMEEVRNYEINTKKAKTNDI